LDERGANAVKQMKELEHLNLADLRTMQDIHLATMIRGMNQLKELNLSGCQLLTSQSMQPLRNHKALEWVDFSECPRVDDAVFNYLMTCKNLRHLNLTRTNCTAAAAKRFREQYLPDCQITGLEGN
jgi:hypothetical protein